MVSIQLVDNGSERERYAQTQKQIQKKKRKKEKKKKKKTINGGMLKARCRTKFLFFIICFVNNINHSLQLGYLNVVLVFLNEYHL